MSRRQPAAGAQVGGGHRTERVMTRTIVRDRSRCGHRQVTTANGQVLDGDHVVLSAPPPVWNRIAI